MFSSSLVAQVTTDDQKPVNGFLLSQLAQKTLESAKECENVQAEVMKRLNKSSPDVKLKALRTIKYLCQHGRADFRIALQRNNSEVRACSHFSAPLDPLRGDQPAIRVRDAAKEALDAIFNTTGAPAKLSSTVGRIEGYSGTSTTAQPETTSWTSWTPPATTTTSTTTTEYTGTFSPPMTESGEVPKIESGLYSTGKMEGFGNPAYPSHKSTPGIFDKLTSKIMGSGSEKSTFKPFEPPGVYTGPTTTEVEEPQAEVAYTGRTHKKGQAGGIWAQEGGSSDLRQSGGSYAPTYGGRDPELKTSRTAEPDEYEIKLVDQITTPSGVRVNPSPKELQDFVKQCETLGHWQIASLLDKKLLSESVPTKVKTLFVIEALMNAGSEETEDYFNDHPQNVESLYKSSSNKTIQEKANQVLILCGAKKTDPIPTPAPTTTSTTYKPVFTTSTTSTTTSTTAPPTAPPTATAPSLLPSFSVFDETPLPPTKTTSQTKKPSGESLFPFLDSSSEDTSGIFGGLTIQETSSAPVTTSSAPKKPASNGTSVDPFELFPTSPPSSTPSLPTTTTSPPKKVDALTLLLTSTPPSSSYPPPSSFAPPPSYSQPGRQYPPPPSSYSGYPPYPQQPYYPQQYPPYGGGYPQQQYYPPQNYGGYGPSTGVPSHLSSGLGLGPLGSTGGSGGGAFGLAGVGESSVSTRSTTSTTGSKSTSSTSSSFDFLDQSVQKQPKDQFNFVSELFPQS